MELSTIYFKFFITLRSRIPHTVVCDFYNLKGKKEISFLFSIYFLFTAAETQTSSLVGTSLLVRRTWVRILVGAQLCALTEGGRPFDGRASKDAAIGLLGVTMVSDSLGLEM